MRDRSSGMEWRRVKPNEWWLVFSDAPEDLGRDGPVGYPPSMTISWVGYKTACCHVRSFYNGVWPDGDPDDVEEHSDYLHVCDPNDLIRDLKQWMETANYVGEDE